MRTREEMLKIDRSALTITSLDKTDEKEFWLSRSPAERFVALELLRQIAYGYEPDSIRLQRVFEIARQK
jgi:hypothetical protein